MNQPLLNQRSSWLEVVPIGLVTFSPGVWLATTTIFAPAAMLGVVALMAPAWGIRRTEASPGGHPRRGRIR